MKDIVGYFLIINVFVIEMKIVSEIFFKLDEIRKELNLKELVFVMD